MILYDGTSFVVTEEFTACLGPWSRITRGGLAIIRMLWIACISHWLMEGLLVKEKAVEVEKDVVVA